MAVEDVRIPDIGDAEDVEVVELCVAVGDEVAKDGPLIVIESDKASMEVPSPIAGRIARIDVAIGDKVSEGQVIVGIEGSAAETEPAEPKAKDSPAPKAKPPPAASEARSRSPAPKQAPAHETSRAATSRLEVRLPEVGDAQEIVVVELGVKVGAQVSEDDLLLVVESDKASMEIPSPVSGTVVEVAVATGDTVTEGALLVIIEAAESAAPAGAEAAEAVEADATEPAKVSAREESKPAMPKQAASAPSDATRAPSRASAKVYAGPAVRRMARELGVDLSRVNGTGARGRIVKDDVQAFVKAALTGSGAASQTAGIPKLPVIDFAKFGPVETVPLSRIRRRGAENLHRSWLNVVHVTQHDEADVTDLEQFRAELKASAAAQGVKITPLAFIMKAVAATLKSYPQFNASLDATIENLILKRYINIGFAVDTPDGLVVPVVKDADQKGVYELAQAIEALSAKARDGKLAPGDMSGGSFSISSLGPIGGTGFTPIVNAPEVAILGVSRLTTKPHWTGTAFEPRQFLPLSLSYDHRAINGAEAGRFVTDLCSALKDLRRVLL